MGVNRLLPRSGQIPAAWRQRLNIFLGSEDWYEAFYETETKVNALNIANHILERV